MVRVRYAPSPTGHIHVGNARTAIFNYLFAKHNNGVFILRLDDTDLERSTDEAINSMIEDITWLGITWDEGFLKGGDYGPYRQTERIYLYEKYINELLNSNKAYRCFCSKEELEEEKRKAEKEKRIYKYRGKCSHLLNTEIEKNLKENKPFSVRLKIKKDEEIVIDDLIRGKVVFNTSEFDDFIIQRPSKVPIYNYATVIDDALMKITHIIRAEEHLSNTPKQVLIYKAIGFDIPQFAHVSLIFAPDHTKLSKRHGAISVGDYKKEGYMPEALFNYLTLLGWSSKDDREFFTKEELIKEFLLENVNRAPAIFDIKKLNWMNHMYINRKSEEEIYEKTKEFLEESILSKLQDKEFALEIIGAVKGNANTLKDIQYLVLPFVEKELKIKDEKSFEILKQKESFEVLNYIKTHIDEIPFDDEENLKIFVESLRDKILLKPKQIYHPLRVALTGTKDGPEIYKILYIFKKEKTEERINQAMKFIG